MVYKRTFKRKRTKISKPLRQAVKKMIKANIETKMVDYYEGLEGAEIYANRLGNIHYLSGVAQGTDDNQRIGDTIKPVDLTVRLMLRFYVNANVNTTYWGNPMRVVIFSYDCSLDNGTASQPIPTDVIRNQNGGLGDSLQKFTNQNNQNAYTILHDKVYTPRRDNNFLPTQIVIRKKIPKTITYSGLLGSAGSASRNAIYMCVYSYFNQIVDTTFAIYTIQSRLRYKDA
jgi:hypothetical protein